MRSLGHGKIDTTMVYLQKVMNREQYAIHGWKEGSLDKHIYIEETRQNEAVFYHKKVKIAFEIFNIN
jgi:hypothetical protein